jgi:hypothetical protein
MNPRQELSVMDPCFHLPTREGGKHIWQFRIIYLYLIPTQNAARFTKISLNIKETAVQAKEMTTESGKPGSWWDPPDDSGTRPTENSPTLINRSGSGPSASESQLENQISLRILLERDLPPEQVRRCRTEVHQLGNSQSPELLNRERWSGILRASIKVLVWMIVKPTYHCLTPYASVFLTVK